MPENRKSKLEHNHSKKKKAKKKKLEQGKKAGEATRKQKKKKWRNVNVPLAAVFKHIFVSAALSDMEHMQRLLDKRSRAAVTDAISCGFVQCPNFFAARPASLSLRSR